MSALNVLLESVGTTGQITVAADLQMLKVNSIEPGTGYADYYVGVDRAPFYLNAPCEGLSLVHNFINKLT